MHSGRERGSDCNINRDMPPVREKSHDTIPVPLMGTRDKHKDMKPEYNKQAFERSDGWKHYCTTSSLFASVGHDYFLHFTHKKNMSAHNT